MNTYCLRFLLAFVLCTTLLLPSTSGQSITRVSVDSAGVQGNGNSYYDSSMSSNGRFMAFMSDASNLVPGDTNNSPDVFVHDRQTGHTARVSVDSAGIQGNFSSWTPSISSDGRFVAFASHATRLVPGDTNLRQDIFVHDRQTGRTTRVSVDSGRRQGNSASYAPRISSDGRLVAFSSDASNLVPGDTNNSPDVFVHDRQTGHTARVSVDSAGIQGKDNSFHHCISSDGRFVAFSSLAANLVPGDTNGGWDIFVHDRQAGQTTRVSVDSAGIQGNSYSYGPSISSDGRFVAFWSIASNLVLGDTNGLWDVFVHDRQTGQTTRVSVDSGGLQGNSSSDVQNISSDGRFVAFRSLASNLVPGDTNGWWDVFVHDRQTGQTTRMSVDSGGLQGNDESNYPCISSDGRFVAFTSEASNLVPGDTNGTWDVFLRDRGATGPSLSSAGNCPGPITLTISNATAGGVVAIVYGPAGVFVKPTPPCQGITLGIAPPTLGGMRTANGAGVVTVNFNAPPGACGRSVQAVDAATCTATNVIVL